MPLIVKAVNNKLNALNCAVTGHKHTRKTTLNHHASNFWAEIFYELHMTWKFCKIIEEHMSGLFVRVQFIILYHNMNHRMVNFNIFKMDMLFDRFVAC